MDLKSIGKRALTPTISLFGGLVTLLLFRRGIGFAPISMGIALTAWIAGGIFARFFGTPAEEVQRDANEERNANNPPSRKRRLLRWLSQSVVVGLYQNVLFFVLPIWFGSAELLSISVIFPLLLAALALFACFDDHFARWVIAHRYRRTAASAVLLFSVSVPAVALQNLLPLRIGVGLCAALAAFFSVLFGFGRKSVPRTLPAGLVFAAAMAVLFYFAGYLLPPVPVQCVQKVASSGVENKLPVGISDRFAVGTPRVYAHFWVAAPPRFHQDIRFQWYVDGEKSGKALPSQIIGGRKKGFRTRTFRSNPRRGRYRVDLETGEGQLIGRVRFRVE